jgi:hypothetical protein
VLSSATFDSGPDEGNILSHVAIQSNILEEQAKMSRNSKEKTGREMLTNI